jgi:energy-coupling factor transporter transmembrane protein EcfT
VLLRSLALLGRGLAAEVDPVILFALLLELFIFVVIVLGFVGGLAMVALALVCAVLAVIAWRTRRRGLSVALVGGALILVPGVVILDLTWRLAAWFFPPLVAEQRKFEAESREKPTLDPAIEDVRRFVKAEATYHAVNGSYFDTPECLARPQDCIPGYTGPAFLDARTASLGQRGGFTWSFHPGAAPPGLEGMPKLSRSSIGAYALLGVPTGVPATSAAHSVCGDFRGVCTFHGSDLHGKAACPGDCPQHIPWKDDTPPVIVAFDPPRAFPGARVKVTAAGSIRIEDWRFGGVAVQYGGVGDNRAELVVPNGAVSGKISLTTPYGTATSATDFVVLTYTRLRIAPTSSRIVVGKDEDLAVTAAVSDGTTVRPEQGLSWASSAPAVAWVDSRGHVQARAPGTARITATFEGLEVVSTVTVAPRAP